MAGVVVVPDDSQISGQAGVDFDVNVYQDLNANAKSG
jgi:hypothetical protein